MKFFIDTNVFIDWILMKKALEQYQDDLEEVIPFHKKIKPSADFLNNVITHKSRHLNYRASPITLTEFPQALIKHAVKRKMYVDNISFNYFEKYWKKFVQSNYELIYELIDEIFETFFDTNKVKLFGNQTINDDYFLRMDELQVEHTLSNPDALIFIDAIKNKANFFVTTDSHFLDNKKLKEDYKKIKIIRPQRANEIVRQNLRH